MNKIDTIRKKIDKIDKSILNLLAQREAQVILLKKLKLILSLPIKDTNREMEVIQKCHSKYQKSIFKKIISESRKLQARMFDLKL